MTRLPLYLFATDFHGKQFKEAGQITGLVLHQYFPRIELSAGLYTFFKLLL